jgi:hypothetical protein
MVKGQPRENFVRLHLNGKKLGMVENAGHPNYFRKHKVQVNLDKK